MPFPIYNIEFDDILIYPTRLPFKLKSFKSSEPLDKPKNSGKYNQDLIDKLDLLNQSFDKLSKAYQPGKINEKPDVDINVKKIK